MAGKNPNINNTNNDFVGNVYLSNGGNFNIPNNPDGIFGNAANQLFLNGESFTGNNTWTTSRTITQMPAA